MEVVYWEGRHGWIGRGERWWRGSFGGREGEAKALLSVGELLSREEGNAVELAAWTLVASTLLNMDEAVTRQ